MSNLDINDLIQPNGEFQSSVNIEYDLRNEDKIRSLIPTSTVCRYVEELLTPVIDQSTQRAKILVGAYGKGKSHITLTALGAMTLRKRGLFERLIAAYKQKGSTFAYKFAHYVEFGPKLLPVIISGSSTDISRSFLYALRSSLTDNGLLELMPKTNFGGALEIVKRWKLNYPDTYSHMEDILHMRGDAIENALSDFNSSIYEAFLEAYPKLTAGNTFDTLSNANVIQTYDEVLDGLQKHGFSGIYVVYDEFSKYLESSIDAAPVSDTKLLQDFAERCNRSEGNKQLHLLLVSHKDLSNYIDSNLPKEKIDGWRGVSGRFLELEIYDDTSQSYELIGAALNKDHSTWTKYLEESRDEIESVGDTFCSKGLFDERQFDLVTFGCFPLHPVTTFALPRISELVAQNERTLFTFISASEPKSLPQLAFLRELYGSFVTPDVIFDYFEPQLKREGFASDTHSIYRIAKTSLGKVEENSLESKIIKTTAIIYLVSQFNILAPTREIISHIYTDAGYSHKEIDAALEKLIKSESIVYLRASDSHVKLKEASGVNINETIHDASEKFKETISVQSILNKYLAGRAVYPSRHNMAFKTSRYFNCRFLDSAEVMNILKEKIVPEFDGDGIIAAVLCDSVEESDLIKDTILQYGANISTVVFAILDKPRLIHEAAYGYAAAEHMMRSAGEDDILREEYKIAIDDYTEILSRFVADYFSPERRKARYYIGGNDKCKITHRKNFSEALSGLCDELYCKTPIINNEVINKNEPSGAALTSRAKILNALCSQNLEPNLGFVGNGQETSIARSVLKVTHAVREYSTNPVIDLNSTDSTIKSATDEIAKFLETGDGRPFSELYERLRAPKYFIGMKKGPIPILLALVLREHRETVCILKDGVEQPIEKKTIEDIDTAPEKYRLSLVDWSPEKARYVAAVARAFTGKDGDFSKEKTADAARRWFVALPQFTRVSKIVFRQNLDDRTAAAHLAFFSAINKSNINPNELLFNDIPKAFDLDPESFALVETLQEEISKCEGFIDEVVSLISRRVQLMFAQEVVTGESLCSTMNDWVDSLPAVTSSRVFSGSGNKIMSAIKSFTSDERVSLMRLAKSVVSLRIEDWDDALYDRFFEGLESFLAEVNSYDEGADETGMSSQAITFISSEGGEQVRVFEAVEYSPRARLLKNQIINSIDEMGQSISKEEKRQVVFEVLKELC